VVYPFDRLLKLRLSNVFVFTFPTWNFTPRCLLAGTISFPEDRILLGLNVGLKFVGFIHLGYQFNIRVCFTFFVPLFKSWAVENSFLVRLKKVLKHWTNSWQKHLHEQFLSAWGHFEMGNPVARCKLPQSFRVFIVTQPTCPKQMIAS